MTAPTDEHPQAPDFSDLIEAWGAIAAGMQETLRHLAVAWTPILAELYRLGQRYGQIPGGRCYGPLPLAIDGREYRRRTRRRRP